jgi:hypothetical protein
MTRIPSGRLLACLAALLLAGMLPSCSERTRGSDEDETPEAECPGDTPDARCIKACGIAVETKTTFGVSYQVQGAQEVVDPGGTYTTDLFTVYGRGVMLELTHAVLQGVVAGTTTLPVCVKIGERGGGDGLAQYLPGGSTFSTNADNGGTAAIRSYEASSGTVEGNFQFDAIMLTGGGAGSAQDPDALVAHVQHGFFRVPRQ